MAITKTEDVIKASGWIPTVNGNDYGTALFSTPGIAVSYVQEHMNIIHDTLDVERQRLLANASYSARWFEAECSIDELRELVDDEDLRLLPILGK